MQTQAKTDYDYDVCLSFAGEDRDYVRRVANELQHHGVRSFYDEHEQAQLWGKKLIRSSLQRLRLKGYILRHVHIGFIFQ